MKIILTKSFISDFDKEFKNYNINHEDLISRIKSTKIINLSNPFIKYKITIKGVSLRGIGIINNNGKMIPIFFVLKKDKNYGTNLVLNKEVLNKVNNKFAIYSKDFENGDYVEY